MYSGGGGGGGSEMSRSRPIYTTAPPQPQVSREAGVDSHSQQEEQSHTQQAEENKTESANSSKVSSFVVYKTISTFNYE